MSYTVKVGYDDAYRTYFVLTSDIPGLNVEAETFERFVDIVQDLMLDLVVDATGTIRFEREIELTSA